jgi:hypothetical protein
VDSAPLPASKQAEAEREKRAKIIAAEGAWQRSGTAGDPVVVRTTSSVATKRVWPSG